MSTILDPGALVVTKKLLASLKLGPPGGRWSFFVPGSSTGLELYVDFDRQRAAALAAFCQFPKTLAGHQVDQVSSRMQKCLLENMERTNIAARIFDALLCGGYAHATPLAEIVQGVELIYLAKLLQDELSHMAAASLYLRPVWGWRAPESPIVSEPLIWVSGTYDLNALAHFIGLQDAILVNGICPPLAHWDGRKMRLRPLDSWIGACANNDVAGASSLQRIRGALSLALPANRSRVFSGATVERWQIRLARDGATTITMPEPLVPPLLSSPEMNDERFAFVRAALVEYASNQRLQVALEYAAAGWEPRGRLGFLHNAIAFDALYGDPKVGVRKSISFGIAKGAANFSEIEDRADMLYRMRNALTHGEVSSIEACPEYLKYVERFHIDPASDQLRILRSCVSTAVGTQLS
ncbi:MAG: hypothetical protein ACM3SS_22780 [Rhodospirillaceae bacterium]